MMRAWAPYVTLIGVIWLAWQILLIPITERAPPSVAIRLAPNSPLVLRRAAESELAAGRIENALELSRRSLAAAPFSARSLSIAGIALSEINAEAADQTLTLAGNWDLRDDPTHAWLMHKRLEQADYHSAFAHGDTLVRRRKDLRQAVFHLFAVAAVEDSRGLAALVGLLASAPPWRHEFYEYLISDSEGDVVLGNLAIALERTAAPMSERELSDLYWHWMKEGRVEAIKSVRRRIHRPALTPHIVDGDFSKSDAYPPFGWYFFMQGGASSSVEVDDIRPNEKALRIQYDGHSVGRVAQHFLILEPGIYNFLFDARTEGSIPFSDAVWKIECIGGEVVKEVRVRINTREPWRRHHSSFSINDNCLAQWLVIELIPEHERSNASAVWLDKIEVDRVGN